MKQMQMCASMHFSVKWNIGLALQIALRDTECPFHVPKAFILENCDEFAVAVREQIVLLHDLEDKMHESDDEK